MSDPLRPTAAICEMVDAVLEPPMNGAKVLALGLGGTLAQVVWTTGSAAHFEAWMPYPRVPLSVKARMSQKWAPTVNSVNPKDPS